MNQTSLNKIRHALTSGVLLLINDLAMAQITISSGAGGAAQAKVTGIFSLVLSLVQVVGYTLFTIAILLVAYKVTYVENYKVVDAKNVVIGGVIFGLAATLASFFTS